MSIVRFLKDYAEHEKGETMRIDDDNLRESLLADYVIEIVTFEDSAISLLAQNKRREASEKLAADFLKANKVYTLRSDTKSEMWIYHQGIYIPDARTHIQEFCRTQLGAAYTPQLTNEVIAKIEADTFTDSNNFFEDADPSLIAIQNGLLNLETKELEDWTPRKRFFTKHPVKYDPAAVCPNWIKHINLVLKHAEDAKVMQELFGFCLLREYRYEKAFMFVGDGRNGKGKTLEVIKRLVGAENCVSCPPEKISNNRDALSDLHHKSVNLAGDISPKTMTDPHWIKTLTGRDVVTAWRKYLPSVTFTNHAKFVFSCNQLPRVYDQSRGFWSRWILFDFPITFVDKQEYQALTEDEKSEYRIGDPSIVDKICTDQELSGILNWALQGLDRLRDQGAFSTSKNTEDVRIEWMRKSDSLQAFIMDCCELEYDAQVPRKEFRNAYNDYCRTNKAKAVSDQSLKNSLSEMGIGESRPSIDGKQVRVWEGIRISQVRQESHGFQKSLGNRNSSTFTETLSNLSNLSKWQSSPTYFGKCHNNECASVDCRMHTDNNAYCQDHWPEVII